MKLRRSPKRELDQLSHIAREVGSVRRVGLTEQLIEKLESLVLKGVLSPRGAIAVGTAARPPAFRFPRLAAASTESNAGDGSAGSATRVGKLFERGGRGGDSKSTPRILVPLRGLTQAELFEVRRSMEGEAAAAAAERATARPLKRCASSWPA